MWRLFKILGRTPRAMLADLEQSPAFQEHLRRLAEASALGADERASDVQSIAGRNPITVTSRSTASLT